MKIKYLTIGFLVGVFLSSTSWWIFRAFEIAPLRTQATAVPLIMISTAQKIAQKTIVDLDVEDKDKLESFRQNQLELVKVFVATFEEYKDELFSPLALEINPDLDELIKEYQDAKEFIKKHEIKHKS